MALFIISPSGLSYEDTYNTLKYADRAMNITCKVIKNELSVDMHISRYAKIVEELRIEVTQILVLWKPTGFKVLKKIWIVSTMYPMGIL